MYNNCEEYVKNVDGYPLVSSLFTILLITAKNSGLDR
jgi:hypothetical protein